MLVAFPKELLHGLVQQIIAVLELGDFQFSAAQIDGCRDHVETGEIRALPLDFRNGHTTFKNVVYRRFAGFMPHAKGCRAITLGIHIDNQYPRAVLCEGGGKIHGRGGLPHPALLVGDRNQTSACRLGKLRFLQTGIAIEFMCDFRTHRRITR